jgi:hypothetical protein
MGESGDIETALALDINETAVSPHAANRSSGDCEYIVGSMNGLLALV